MTSSSSVLLHPTAAQALDLLGEWVTCGVVWVDDEPVHRTEPAQIVGVVVAAPGSGVRAQILMHAGGEHLVDTEGYQYELLLDSIRFIARA